MKCEVCLASEQETVVSLDPPEIDSGEDVAVCGPCAQIYAEQHERMRLWIERLIEREYLRVTEGQS